MFDPKLLLEQVLGSGTAGDARSAGGAFKDRLDTLSGSKGFASGRGAPAPANLGALALPHAQPAADGSAFELTLVQAMVGAAKADGHIDAAEQRRLFAEVERLGLDADAKAYVFDLLTHDVEIASLVNSCRTPEQGAELYLAARLAIDPDEPAERAYLDALAAQLRLPAELRATLDAVQSTPA